MIYTVAVVVLAIATIAICAAFDYKNGYLSNPFKKN